EANRVGRMAAFGPGLGQILRPSFDVTTGPGERHRERGRLKTARSFVGVPVARELDGVLGVEEFLDVPFRQTIEIEVSDRIVAGVREGGDEMRPGGDSGAGSGETAAHGRIIQNMSRGAGVRAARVAAAGAAIVSGLVRVIDAVRAVADEDHQVCEVLDEADV